MERIVFLDRATLDTEVRRPVFPHEWSEYAQTRASETVARLHDATIAITNKVPLRADALAQLPGLRMIAVAATGVDVIDLAACRRRGITVSNVRGYGVRSVPEHVLMLIFALRRNLLSYRADVSGGAWQHAEQFCLLDHPIRDIAGAALGVIGYGALGQATAKLARAVGLKTLIAERKGATVARDGRMLFEEVLRGSDIITLHVPLNEETRGLIGATELRAMRREALLINCARGGVVDEAALAEALRAGVIAGAGVDALSTEPPKNGNPLLELDLDLANLIVTPHIAWASREAMQTLANQLIANIEAFVRGEPQNTVTSDE